MRSGPRSWPPSGRAAARADEREGTYGPELRAMVPTEVPGQGVVLAPARFVGVDGPRWFLRGLLTGPAATDDDAAAPLLTAMRDVAVNRGSDPMAVRDPLPLVLPSDAMQAVAEAAAEDVAGPGAAGARTGDHRDALTPGVA